MAESKNDDNGQKDAGQNTMNTLQTDLPSIGDLSGLDDDLSPSHEIGDSEQLDNTDLIGDLSLLDEAIAELDEMETSGATAAVTQADEGFDLDGGELTLQDADGDSQPLSLADEDDIPVLVDAIGEIDAGTIEEIQSAMGGSISGLEDDVMDFGGAAEKASGIVDALGVASELPEGDFDIDLSDQLETLSEPTPSLSVAEEEIKSIAERMLSGEQSASSLEDLGDVDMVSSGLEGAASLAESVLAESGFGATSSESLSAMDDLSQEKTASKGKGSQNLRTAIHDQLMSKIDELVAEAINAMGDDLNTALEERVEQLISAALDQAVPTVIQKLRDDLRDEIQRQVRQQLPQMVADLMEDLSENV